MSMLKEMQEVQKLVKDLRSENDDLRRDLMHYRMQADALEAHLNSSMRENCRLREQIAAQEPTDGERLAERAVIEAAEAWDEELPEYMYAGLFDDDTVSGDVFKAMDDLVTARTLRLSDAVKALKAARGDQE
jgi:ribosomal protein L29